MFSDEPTIKEIRKIIKFKITGEKWLVKSRLLQKSETLLNRQSADENFSDEPTITEIRTITDSAITRQTFLLMSRLLQKLEILPSQPSLQKKVRHEPTITENIYISLIGQ